jgi:hypothetical protein
MTEKMVVEVPGAGSVTTLRSRPDGPARGRFLYAPGAGSGLHDAFGARCAERLPTAGIECWRFQFPYMEAGRRAPDKTPILEATWRAVIDAALGDVPLVVGGRSMGGRIASHVVATGVRVAALALFAYPLHPPGKPDQLRTVHLSPIGVPTLFCSGNRDVFGSPNELAAAVALVPDARLHFLDGADHGFVTLKSSGHSRSEVWDEAVDAFLAFLDPLLPA